MSDQIPFIPGAARDLDLTAAETRVLFRVLTYAQCWESVRSMARALKCARATIQSALDSLTQKGILTRSSGPGKQLCHEWNPACLKRESEDHDQDQVATSGGQVVTSEGHYVAKKSDTMALYTEPRGNLTVPGGNLTVPQIVPSDSTKDSTKSTPLIPQGGKSKPRKPVDVFPKLRFPAELSSKKFQEAFRGWVEFRMEVSPGKAPKDWVRLFQQQLDRHVPEFTESEISEAIRSATTAGWTGFFPKKAVNGYHKNHVPKQSETDQSIF